MTERSSIAQVVQIGVEATPGTAVPATRRLGSMSFTPSVNAETDPFTPRGSKFPTIVTLNREWTDLAMEGRPTFQEVVYPLAACIGAPTVAELMDGATATGVYDWTFSPSTTSADAPKTLTIEHGQAGVQAEKAAHGLLTAFSMSISRSEVTMDGSGFARALQTGITPTAGLTMPSDLTPMTPGMWSAYLADDQAALSVAGGSDATKRLTRLVSASPSVEDRFNPAWFVNHTEDSFATWVENPDGVGGSTSVMVEANAEGMGHLTTLRNGDTKFLRLEALGPVLYDAGVQPGTRARFRWDQAVKISGVEQFSDEDGIYAIGFTFQPVHDATWGKAMEFGVRNDVASLT